MSGTDESPFDDTAAWIAAPTETDPAPAPLLRRPLDLDAAPAEATLHVASGGTATAWVNGDPVGEPGELGPAFADYEDRVHVRSYDVTDALTAGRNVLAVTLGRGRYAMLTQRVWEWDHPPWHADRPCLRARLDIRATDGTERTVGTDDAWRAADGPTHFDSLYEGEHVDARDRRPGWRTPGFDAGDGWRPAERVDGPAGTLRPQPIPPIRECRRVHPRTIDAVEPGCWVVDFGEMVAGWTAIEVDADRGTELTLTHSERTEADGTVAVHTINDNRFQTDRYVCRGDGLESWAPQFSYRGFRYLQVEADEPTALDDWAAEAVVAHTPVEAGDPGSFTAGDVCLNRIHENTRRAILNNYHDIPTDTPVFEKNGWTGDAQWTATAALYDLAPEAFFRKWLDDYADSQLPSGEVPPIVPTSGWGYNDPESDIPVESPNPVWDATYPILTWRLYEFTGDATVCSEHLDNCRELVDHYGREWAADGPGGVVDVGLGDWVAPHNPDFPFPPEGTAITGTTHYHRMADLVARIADVAGDTAAAREYRDLADRIARTCNEAFLDGDTYRTGAVDAYRQTSNVLPLAFDIVPPDRRDAVRARLVRDVRETHDRHLNTGALGTRHLLDVLTRGGHVDLAYDVATQTTYPSWGHWIVEADATALFESWGLDARSRDHHFLGSIVDWFYRHLAGIAPAEPGFETVRIAPSPPADLPWAGGTVDTPRGPVTTRWDRTDDGLRLAIELPDGLPAHVEVPTSAGVAVDGGAPDAAVERAESPPETTRLAVEGGDWTVEW